MSEVTMRQLLEAGVHFGHQTRFWCPKNARYIYGSRNKIHIINLEQTLPAFNEAMNFIGSVAARKGTVMFVGTKRQASKIVQEQATRANMPYVNHRWLGGMLTNFKTVRNSVTKLKNFDAQFESGEINRLGKKEALRISREREKLDRSLAGIKNMNRLPEALFVLDVDYENIAVAEANKLGIPVIGVVDTNSNPKGVDYVIPGNDDSIKSITLYFATAADAVLNAKGAQPVIEGDDEYIEVEAAVEETPAASEAPAASKV